MAAQPLLSEVDATPVWQGNGWADETHEARESGPCVAMYSKFFRIKLEIGTHV